MDRTEAKPAERPVYHPYSLGSLALSDQQSQSHSPHCLESYSYSPTSSSLIKTSPGLPPCQPYKTAFTSSLSALGEVGVGVGVGYSGITSSVGTVGTVGTAGSVGSVYQPQYQHNLAFTDQASLASANTLLTSTNTISDFQDPSTIIKTENDNCNNLDEEEDTTEEEEKSDKEDCKEGNNKPPYSYVAMIGESPAGGIKMSSPTPRRLS